MFTLSIPSVDVACMIATPILLVRQQPRETSPDCFEFDAPNGGILSVAVHDDRVELATSGGVTFTATKQDIHFLLKVLTAWAKNDDVLLVALQEHKLDEGAGYCRWMELCQKEWKLGYLSGEGDENEG